jgi:hypothetical protein
MVVQTFSLALLLMAVSNEPLEHVEFGMEMDHKHIDILYRVLYKSVITNWRLSEILRLYVANLTYTESLFK